MKVGRTNFFLRLLKKMYLFSLQEGYSGDIEEEYFFIVRNNGKFRANFWLWLQVFKSVPIFLKSYPFADLSIVKISLLISVAVFQDSDTC